jgi:hypothetical protein
MSTKKLFTLAGLAASAYFLMGPNAKKNQKHAKAWAIKMKGDVVEKLEAARSVTEPIYHEIINSVAAKHEKGKKTTPEEIMELAKELKKHWKTISGSAVAAKGDVVKTAKRVAKKIKVAKK